MANISKADLIKIVAHEANLTSKDAKVIIEAFLNAIEGHLQQGESVQLTGFGSFEVRQRKARTGVKPGTTEKVNIPASTYPAFKPGKQLKDYIK